MNQSTNMPVALAGGIVYLLMALTVWQILRGTPQAALARLWAAGALCLGSAMVLIPARAWLAPPLGFGAVVLLACAGMVLQTAALRRHLGWPWRGSGLQRPAQALAVLALVAMPLLFVLGQRAWLFVLACAVVSVLAGTLAWHAQCVARQARSGSARLLAVCHWALAAALLLRGLSVAGGWASHQPGQGGAAFVLLHATAVLTALYGSLGFMGLLLQLARHEEASARDAQQAERAARALAEAAALDLRQLMQQRDDLSLQRERLLQLLAHEIRQPLHNASGALRAAGAALREPPPAGATTVGQRLDRAEAVLGEVRAVLDNALAAATLISRKAPLAMQDVDLDFLVDLTLGDLGDAQRGRVQVCWQTDLRHAEVEPGLVRLALRNLLLNALKHGGPDAAVALQVDEQALPPSLLLRVADNGPGLAPDRTAHGQGTGTGLQIVRQVMALHGGQLTLLPASPRGLQATLVLPLPAV